MKYLKLLITSLLLIGIIILGIRTIPVARRNQQYKLDHSELNHFAYGLLSVDVWKQQITGIISTELESFDLNRANQGPLRKQLEHQLSILIDKVYQRIVRENLKTMGGKIKQTLMDSFVDLKEIKEGVPEYATAILKDLNRPGARTKIKGLLKNKITEYLNKTYDTKAQTPKDIIVARYGKENEEDTRKLLSDMILRDDRILKQQAVYIIALAVFLFLITLLSKGPLHPFEFFSLTVALLILLMIGVTTPMIDMDARITQLNIMLLGHSIEFDDQVLYFQSKSIIDVFRIMITHKEIQMKLVGILIVSFSIVFPVLKVISSFAWYYDWARVRTNRLVEFFAMKSGKWSMADVMVVAIFMAYIGFNGIINSQLKDIGSMGENPEVFTTNGTSLQPGFYLFLSYSILAMVLSALLKARPRPS